MHYCNDFNEVTAQPVNHPVRKMSYPAFANTYRHLTIDVGMTLYPVQRFFEIIKETQGKTRTFTVIKGGGRVCFCFGFSMPAKLHGVYFSRSSLMTIALSSSAA